MKNILDIICNIGAIVMFGSLFYAMYIMDKQDKETGFITKRK